MKPAEAAKMLADLNWSGMPTTHQVAVSAALETLKGLTEPDARYEQTVSRATRKPKGAAMVLDFETAPIERHNVVALPVAPRTRWTSLHHLDGSRFASSSGFTDGGAWNWILDTVSAEHRVHVDQISGAESDETQPYDCDDLVLVDGLPVYRIRHSGTIAK